MCIRDRFAGAADRHLHDPRGKRSQFAQGHDAKLKGMLKLVEEHEGAKITDLPEPLQATLVAVRHQLSLLAFVSCVCCGQAITKVVSTPVGPKGVVCAGGNCACSQLES